MTIAQRLALSGILLAATPSCGHSAPPSREATPLDGSASAALTAPPAPPPSPVADAGSPKPDAGPPADGGAPSAAADAAATAPAPVVADNKVSPTEGQELQDRAKGLFEAIVKDEPERGEAFWFPEAPFIPLKDVKDPGKYWKQLHRAYVNDIHALHKKRKRWDGAEMVKFEGWARTKWVPPGDEANKIGYYRAFHGKLRYTVDGKDAAIDVHTIITWQGRWHVTHLRKFKK